MFAATPMRAGSEPVALANRRAILKGGAAAAGTLLIGFRMSAPTPANADAAVFAPDAFIRIDTSGAITLIMPQVEMGQGIYTAISMILAEELDAAFDRITLEAAPPNTKLYANPVFGIQATGGSTSVRAWWTPMRKAGAAARALLVAAAAQIWGVDPATCRTANSEVLHDPSGRSLGYGALVGKAAAMTPPKDPPLKPVSKFQLVGKPLKRLDTPHKVDGRAEFGIDVLPPGVKFATLAACPVFGGKVGRVDDGLAKSMPGVRQIVVLDDLVAVVGDHMWAAMQGLAALDIVWDEGANASVSSAQVWTQIRAASEKDGVVAKTVGDPAKSLSSGGTIEAAYELPFLAHATMEPLNCTVHVTPDACEIWVGSQILARAQAVAAKVTGLPLDKVVVHNHLIGGGFGRRLEVDYVETAVRIAQKVDGPVKVVWTREQDIQHDIYRPVYHDRLTASLAEGKILGWKHRITGSSIMARWYPEIFKDGIDVDAIDSAVDMPYEVPNLRVEYVREEPPAVPTGFWRGVGPNNNIFAIESFIDELAAKTGRDPVAFRRGLLEKSPRLLAAIGLVASKAGWGGALPPWVGRGICAQISFGSFVATVAEVEVDGDGEVHVRRVVSAVDTGIVVNPDTTVAQLQGGLIFGITAALYGEITIENGRIQQSNFNDYRMLRIDQAPAIEVHLIKSGEAPGGIGETGTTAGPPAIVNAIFAATGVRLRRLPIDREALAQRKPA
jgi:isoquinoline 1-oxidoreductase beta subunit